MARQAAGVVVDVIDGATVKLSDGQIVRLAGLITPSVPLAVSDGSDAADPKWPPADEAKSALASLVANNASIEIAVADQKARTDRHGRTLAHVVATTNGVATWLQGEMLQRGQARVTSMQSGGQCLLDMLTIESAARSATRGLWANAAYRPVDASNTDALKRQRVSFALVEGVVVGVAERGGQTYLNFGRDWRWDFTASVSKAVAKRNPTAAQKLEAMTGQRVRVRGWVDQRNGPLIEIGDLAEIETLE